MKKILSCIFSILLISPILSGCASKSTSQDNNAQKSNQPVKMKISLVVSEKTPSGQAMKEFAEKVNQELADKIKVEIFYDSTLYKDAEELVALSRGDVQMLNTTIAKLPTLNTAWEVLNLPGVFDNTDQAQKILNGTFGNDLKQTLDKQSIVGLNYWFTGNVAIFTNKRAVHVPEDLKGLRLRIPTTKAMALAMSKSGAGTVDLPLADVYQSLQTGVIDGELTLADNALTLKHTESLKHATRVPFGPAMRIVLVNKNFWNSLSEDTRTKLQGILNDVTDKTWKEVSEQENKAFQNMEASGINVYVPKAEEMKKWTDLFQPVWDTMGSSIGTQWIQKLREAKASAK